MLSVRGARGFLPIWTGGCHGLRSDPAVCQRTNPGPKWSMRQDHDPDDGDADDQRQALHQVGDRGQPLAPDHHELIVRREVQVMAPVLRFGNPVNPFRPLFPVD